MRFTLSWLKRFLNTKCNVTEIAEALTSIGLEVEEIIDSSKGLEVFEVAHIISTTPHPSADRLKICMVKTKDEVLQIVCGASNAREDIKVVLARIGTEIPNGKFKIKESIIRGEKSLGMLCSFEELLLAKESEEGIIELPKNAIIGDSFIKYYDNDPVFVISVTPNRGDALGVYGIARDLAAKGLGILKPLEIPEIENKFQSKVKLDVKDTASCPLFLLREIRGVRNCQSPDWLQQLLKNIGINTISALVDITNYISYSFAQPMHAYDADRLEGHVRVELLKNTDCHSGASRNPALKFHALNDKEYNLHEGELVVRDNNEILALAGIIGGTSSACTGETANILLEAAVFDAKIIAKTGRCLQIDTDSRHRFERNIDQNFTIQALDIATEMILSICGGEVSEIIKVGADKIELKQLKFSLDCLEKITGLKLEALEIIDILKKLGFTSKIEKDIINITIPSWRHDIAIKEDIVEEIVRIYGYDKLETTTLPDMCQGKIISQEQKRTFTLKRILASRGYDEVVTSSFMKSGDAELFTSLKDELFIMNPISLDHDYMRPTIISNLLQLVSRNLARSVKDIAFFEVGPIFASEVPIEGEQTFVSGVRCGTYMTKNCHEIERLIDVFDIKADLEYIFDYLGLSLDKYRLRVIDLPYYHPTRSVSINLNKNLIGYFGQIHPLILKYFNIEQEVFSFEINLANVPLSKVKYGRKEKFIVSDFQINFRDYAFIIDKDQPVGEIISFINNFNKKLVKSVELFDIYSGEKLPVDKKSIAIKIQLQADDRTLNESDLTSFSQEIILAVEQKFHAKLREKNVE